MVVGVSIVAEFPMFPQCSCAIFEHVAPAGKRLLVYNIISGLVVPILRQQLKHIPGSEYSRCKMIFALAYVIQQIFQCRRALGIWKNISMQRE